MIPLPSTLKGLKGSLLSGSSNEKLAKLGFCSVSVFVKLFNVPGLTMNEISGYVFLSFLYPVYWF